MIQWEHLQEESNVNELSNIRNHNNTSIRSCFLPTLAVHGHLLSLCSSTILFLARWFQELSGRLAPFVATQVRTLQFPLQILSHTQSVWEAVLSSCWCYCTYDQQQMIGLGEQISSRGCCEATDVVGILLLFNLALWILWIPSEGLAKWRELIGDGDFRVMLLQIQTNYDRNMAFIAFFQSLIRWSMCQGDLPDGLVGLPVTRFSLLQITATASLKAWSSFDWSQQLSQLSLRQVGSDFCSQFISDHLSSKICVDLSCFGGYADSTTSTG